MLVVAMLEVSASAGAWAGWLVVVALILMALQDMFDP